MIYPNHFWTNFPGIFSALINANVKFKIVYDIYDWLKQFQIYLIMIEEAEHCNAFAIFQKLTKVQTKQLASIL